jgi:hypothetical protein
VKASILIALAAALGGCADTGQEPVTLAASGTGTAAAPISVGAYTITLTRADVGFGPAYFCAGFNADGDQCATAVVELRRTVAIDALDPTAQDLGGLDGVTGTVRSAMYDWGVSWALTRDGPAANPGAPEGHSLIIAGTATGPTATFAFSAAVDALPAAIGAPTMRAQHTMAEITGDDVAVAVHVDPSAWLAQIPFADLDDGQGTALVLEPGTAAYSALVVGMTTAAPATFAWTP